MFDHSWNKGNQRLSQAWEKASKKQDAPAANALPTSVLLQRVLAPDRGKWKGGALKRVGDGLRENEERAAHPKLNMGQPAPRPPAPTARFGVNPLSRGAPSAPAVNGSAGRHTQSAPVVDDAMREQMERRRLEALRKLAARAPAPGATDALPARAPAPSHVACETKANKQNASRAPSSIAFGPSRDETQRRRLSGGAARGARAADATAPDQFFGVELFLAHEASPDGSVETFDRLHVRAKSFPGYPANAVLSWATSPASPAGETKKWLLEKGEVSVWRVTPATAYRALLDRAKREPLLAVQDAVASRVARAGAARDAADQTLARAEEECAALGADVPADVAERARAARLGAKKEALRAEDATEKNARAERAPSVLGATRRRPPPSKAVFAGTRGVSVSVPRFARPAWESRDVFASLSRDGSSDAERGKRAETSASSELEPREVGGFDEKGLASVLAAATQLAPGRRVSPATADAADFVRVLRYAQRQHGLDLGVPRQNAAETSAPRALYETIERVPPLVLRAARRCGFPTDFARRASTLAKADAKKSKAGAAVFGDAGSSPSARAAPEDPPPAGTADDVLDLVSDYDDDDDDDDEEEVVVIDEDDDEPADDEPAATPPAKKKPAAFVIASPSVLASALAELRAAVGDLEKARAELDRVEKAVRNVVKRKRARAFGPREAVFEGDAFGLGVDFATGAGAGWEGAGTASMGMDVNAW